MKHIILEISDNGKGLDEDIDIDNVDTLGLQLISTIAKNQLLGSIEYENNNGVRFIIQFFYK